MSTETTNKKIKIDNGTTFGRTYTDKAVDELLKNVGSGQAMFDITQYINDAGDSISQEGYTLLKEGISSGKYAGIVFGYWNAYPVCIDDSGGLRFQYINFEPDSPNDVYKLLTIDKNTLKISGAPWDAENQNFYIYSSFYIKPYFEGGTSSLPYYNATTNEQQNLTIGDGLTIENGALKTTGGGGSGSSKVWYELPSLFFLENITQEQFDEIKNLALQNQLAGINCSGLYCPLTAYIDGPNIVFFYPWYENDIFTAQLIRLNTDLSVEKIPYSTITLPQTAPSSQVIPSITISNEQQNLTIGNGLVVDNGALKTIGTKYYEITITRNLFDYNGKTTDEKANYVSYATDYTLKFIIDETNYNALLNSISTKLGFTVDTAYLINNYSTLKQNPEYISGIIDLLKVCVVGSISSITNSTNLAYINNCCYIAIPSIEGEDSWFKCSSGFFGTLCSYDADKKKMAKIGWDSVAENSTLIITTKYL